MSTQAIFAKEYYKDPCLFLKGAEVHINANGTTQFTLSSTNFWKTRNLRPCVDNQGTVTTFSQTYFEDLKQNYCFYQDPHAITAHRRLKELEATLQNPLSPELQTLKAEIHNHGLLGATKLETNLKMLEEDFQRNNQRGFLTSTLIKIINFMRRCFSQPEMEFYHFTPLHLQAFHDRAIAPALELTAQDSLRTKYFPCIQNHSPFPLPPELSGENLQRLELGLLDEISFSVDQKYFCLAYDRTQEKFIFSYSSPELGRPLHPSQTLPNRTIIVSSPILNIVEKKLWDNSISQHPLQRTMTMSHISRPWYFLEEETWRWHLEGGTMNMGINCEYTIPLSQGSLSFTLFPRAH